NQSSLHPCHGGLSTLQASLNSQLPLKILSLELAYLAQKHNLHLTPVPSLHTACLYPGATSLQLPFPFLLPSLIVHNYRTHQHHYHTKKQDSELSLSARVFQEAVFHLTYVS